MQETVCVWVQVGVEVRAGTGVGVGTGGGAGADMGSSSAPKPGEGVGGVVLIMNVGGRVTSDCSARADMTHPSTLSDDLNRSLPEP